MGSTFGTVLFTFTGGPGLGLAEGTGGASGAGSAAPAGSVGAADPTAASGSPDHAGSAGAASRGTVPRSWLSTRTNTRTWCNQDGDARRLIRLGFLMARN